MLSISRGDFLSEDSGVESGKRVGEKGIVEVCCFEVGSRNYRFVFFSAVAQYLNDSNNVDEVIIFQ